MDTMVLTYLVAMLKRELSTTHVMRASPQPGFLRPTTRMSSKIATGIWMFVELGVQVLMQDSNASVTTVQITSIQVS